MHDDRRRWPPGWGLMMAIAISCFLWGALLYGAWWVWFR